LLAIVATLILTIGTQFYWNANNFRQNRSVIKKEIVSDFEKSVEEFYVRTGAANSYTVIDTRKQANSPEGVLRFLELIEGDSLAKYFKNPNKTGNYNADLGLEEAIVNLNGFTLVRGKTLLENNPELARYTNRITLTIQPDTIPIFLLHELLGEKLSSRSLELEYSVQYIRQDSLWASVGLDTDRWTEKLSSKSDFIPEGDHILLSYNISFASYFRRGLVGIVLSALLSLAVVLSLLYLTRTIGRQKKLTEMKDDFISNLTHEFKTPIATASAALQTLEMKEGSIKGNSVTRYSGIAQDQLKKLNTMVEKLLETASLHADHLIIRKEHQDIRIQLEDLVNRFREQRPGLAISLHVGKGDYLKEVDPFHWENSLYNLLENAAEYGRPPVEVRMQSVSGEIRIEITDKGGGLSPEDSERIFHKFYRIPSGNQHNQKGHGIGLYYARTIVEKHGGRLQCIPGTDTTTFQISLP